MIDEGWPAAADDSLNSAVGPAESRSVSGPLSATGPRSVSGSRSARKKRGLFRRTGVVLPAAGIAAVLVAIVVVASYLMAPKGTGASSLFASIDNLDHSGSVTALEQERLTIIAMDAAASTLTVDAKPATANPTSIAAAAAAAANAPSGTSGTGQTGGGTTVNAPAAPADPTGAEAIGKALLPSFGFNQTTQWDCLYNLWMRESGWNVYAENTTSGAYGIPQSLPGEKMASVASDWQTNPTTQIKWGLGYISATYGTPCGAWQNEVNLGYY
jgi:hypothetical protein